MKIDPVDQTKWKKDLFQIYDKIKSHTEAYESVSNGVSIVILPNVFSPKYFTDSEYFAKVISETVGDKSLLEVGTGTGIVALSAALRGSNVTALDINPDAVENTKLNFKKYNISTDNVLFSDVYSALGDNQKFDFIFWNHPFNNWPEQVEDVLLLAGLDYQYTALSRYVSDAYKHLKEGGRLLLGTGNNADLSSINIIAQENGYVTKVIAEEIFPLEAEGDLINSYLVLEFVKQ